MVLGEFWIPTNHLIGNKQTASQFGRGNLTAYMILFKCCNSNKDFAMQQFNFLYLVLLLFLVDRTTDEQTLGKLVWGR